MSDVREAVSATARWRGRPVLVTEVLEYLRANGCEGCPTNRLAALVVLTELADRGEVLRYTDRLERPAFWPAPVTDEFDENEVTEPDLQRQVPVG